MTSMALKIALPARAAARRREGVRPNWGMIGALMFCSLVWAAVFGLMLLG